VEPGKRLQKSVGALLIVAIIHTLLALMAMSQARAAAHEGIAIDGRAMAIALTLPLAFYALAVWARWMPTIASSVGLALYVGVQVYNAIVYKSPIRQGIVVKVIIVLALVQAIRAGLEYSRARREAIAGNGAGGNGVA
jgi:hypothetical protein